MNKLAIIRRLLAFAVGATLLVIGDYLYGTTYYTDRPGEPDRFLVSGLLGMAASCGYLYGLFGYYAAFHQESRLYRVLIIGGLSLFTVGVATTHSLASAHMVAFNQQLLTPNVTELDGVFRHIDSFYEAYFIPMIIGLLVGYGALFVAILQRKTVFPRWTLWFHPLPLAIIISALDATVEWGILFFLNHRALGGVVFNVALAASVSRKTVTVDSAHLQSQKV